MTPLMRLRQQRLAEPPKPKEKPLPIEELVRLCGLKLINGKVAT